jgi:predicted hotdog family 3-hydroxylacyl-ACP dehydratase
MLFLDDVVETSWTKIVTETTFGPDFLLAKDGRVSPLVVIELFAQSAAALMAHRSAQSDAPDVSGYLLGAWKLDVTVDSFSVGDTVRTEAEEKWGAGALAQFACKCFVGDQIVAEGAINVAAGQLPADGESML